MSDYTIQNTVQPVTGNVLSKNLVEKPNLGSFGEILIESIGQVNRLQTEANSNINDLATGKQPDIHRTMIAMEKASVSFELLMQIRNKVISAYDRIMRMPI
ncbi:MAG: flagellar hook-basal body complex protein FliE [Desulfobacterales bacterium]|jgi:flagellar hook-basal body complex protein FliE